MWRGALYCVMGSCLVVSASCGAPELRLGGQVTVDGKPIDSGTIRFEQVDNATGKSAGGSVIDGVMTIAPGHELSSGRYRVHVQAFKKTGRTLNDPQRGPIPEMIPLDLSDSPKEIEVAAENSNDLAIEFTTTRP